VYRVKLRSKKVQKQLDHLSPADFRLVDEKLLSLAENPRPAGCRKLVDHIYRVRAGAYRIVYFVDDKNQLVEVGKIERRRERTYKDIEKLFR